MFCNRKFLKTFLNLLFGIESPSFCFKAIHLRLPWMARFLCIQTTTSTRKLDWGEGVHGTFKGSHCQQGHNASIFIIFGVWCPMASHLQLIITIRVRITNVSVEGKVSRFRCGCLWCRLGFRFWFCCTLALILWLFRLGILLLCLILIRKCCCPSFCPFPFPILGPTFVFVNSSCCLHLLQRLRFPLLLNKEKERLHHWTPIFRLLVGMQLQL